MIDEFRLIAFFVILRVSAPTPSPVDRESLTRRPPAPTKNQAVLTTHLRREAALAKLVMKKASGRASHDSSSK
jgi:hypothetical protein